MEIPPHVTVSEQGGSRSSIRFGFDTKTNDYKVVRFQFLQFRDNWDGSPPNVEVYSLLVNGERLRLCLAQVLYAIVTRRFLSMELCIGLHSRELKTTNFLTLLWCLIWGIRSSMRCCCQILSRMSIGCLDLFQHMAIPVAYFKRLIVKCVDIWLMKEYGDASSWTKIAILVDQGPREWEYIPWANGFRKSGEVILEEFEGPFVSQNLESQEIKDLRISFKDMYNFVDSYVESPVLLDKPSRAITY